MNAHDTSSQVQRLFRPPFLPYPGISIQPGSAVRVYTDGACSGNPGPGGWGVLIKWDVFRSIQWKEFYGGERKEFYGGETGTTNNRMEIMAAIAGLSVLPADGNYEVKLFTDSQYVQKGMSEWLAGWKAKGWRTGAGDPVKNKDLWQQLEAVASRHRVQCCWVKAHNGHAENERADELARQGCMECGR